MCICSVVESDSTGPDLYYVKNSKSTSLEIFTFSALEAAYSNLVSLLPGGQVTSTPTSSPALQNYSI